MSGPTIITVDARGLRCPLPVLRLAKAMRADPQVTVFDVVADDPAAAKDVPAYAQENGLRIEARGALAWRLTRPPRTPPGDQ